MNVFVDIYKNNEWSFGSGLGSLASVTKGYRKFVEKFLNEHPIKSVIDFGCGDWQFSQYIEWGTREYLGLDIVPTVLENNTRKYARKNIRFAESPSDINQLPSADLLIVKDVLQHFSEQQIFDFLPQLKKYKYALITNCILPEVELNKNISNGEFRPLDLRKSPFSLQLEEVFSFSSPGIFSWRHLKLYPSWKKVVLLWKNENPLASTS